jgi:hypothetical protein
MPLSAEWQGSTHIPSRNSSEVLVATLHICFPSNPRSVNNTVVISHLHGPGVSAKRADLFADRVPGVSAERLLA